jgi:hypothetical protein
MATYMTGRRSYSVRSDRIIQNVLPKILLLDRDIMDAGFIVFFNRLPTRSTKAETFNWDIDQYLPSSDTLSAAVASTTQTTILVSNPSYFNTNQAWQNTRTLEVIGVTGVNIGTSNLTVTRGLGTTAAANMNSGDTLVRLGTYVGENSTRQTFQSTVPTSVTNYCQQMRMDLSLSERQIKRQFENDSELPLQQFKILQEFRMDMDRTFLFMEKSRGTDSSGEDYTTTDGLKSIISSNTFAVNGTLYKSDLDEFMVEQGMRYGSRNKILFASTDVILAFTEMVDSNLTFQVNVAPQTGKAFGTEVLKYVAPNGHSMLIVEDRNISNFFNGEAYLADMAEITRMVFSNNGHTGELHIIKNTEDPDDPGVVHTLMGDMGLMYGNEINYASITGVSGGSYTSAKA